MTGMWLTFFRPLTCTWLSFHGQEPCQKLRINIAPLRLTVFGAIQATLASLSKHPARSSAGRLAVLFSHSLLKSSHISTQLWGLKRLLAEVILAPTCSSRKGCGETAMNRMLPKKGRLLCARPTWRRLLNFHMVPGASHSP